MDRAARYLDDPGPVGLFTRLARVGMLVDAFQHRCLDPFGLRFVDYSVLRVLQLAHQAQVTPTELCEILLRSSGGVTQIVDRLEAAGLVARRADPGDRRRVVVALTGAGLEIARRANTAYARERRRILRTLSEEEVALADDAIRVLLAAFSTDAAAAARA